jgi:prophage regulatory protein
MADILRIKDVVKKTSMCRASVYNLINRGEFPPQKKLIGNRVGWNSDEVEMWIASRESISPTSSRSDDSKSGKPAGCKG